MKLSPLGWFLTAALLSGCSPESTPSSIAIATTGERPRDRLAQDEYATDPVSTDPVRSAEILSPRGTDEVKPAEYIATESTFRLFGVDGTDDARTATIAETRRWSTRTYKLGEFFGRGLRVRAITEDSVTLEGPEQQVVLRVGVDTRVRVLRHPLDVVARPLGRHRFVLEPEAARAAVGPLPSFELVQLYETTMLKLGPIAPGSLLDAAGFKEGDLLSQVDSAPVSERTLVDLERTLKEARPSVHVQMVRGGVPFERAYLVAGAGASAP
jgi:hypothetical protein